jgi:hypothetical protein
MEGLTKQDLEYLTARGLAATEATDLDGPTSPPSVYLHHFSRDGVLRWIWTDPLESVPPGTPPVTEPADYIAELRRNCGWEADRPVYGTDGGMLRLYRQGGAWLLDNRPATIMWFFDCLERAVDAAVRYFTHKATGA